MSQTMIMLMRNKVYKRRKVLNAYMDTCNIYYVYKSEYHLYVCE